MSTFFDFTYNLNTENQAQQALESINNEKRVKSVARTHFFTDINLSNQGAENAFGPVLGNEDSQFRVTSKFNIVYSKNAYAVTEGHLYFAPHGDSTDKVNVVLKPKNPVYIGVGIKYFIYRGVNINNLFKHEMGIIKLIQKNDPLATDFVKRLWDEFIEFNELNEEDDNVFNSEELGYTPDSEESERIIDKFYNKENGYNLPLVKSGEPFGKFSDTVAFEIVVDYGDYDQFPQESGFELDYGFLCAKECVLNVDANNPEYIAGNKPESISEKIFRENIYLFLDPAAYYGAHISKNEKKTGDNTMGRLMGRVEYRNLEGYNENTNEETNHQPTTGTDKWGNLTFPRLLNQYILKRFFTGSTIYLYITGSRGRSYNYNNEVPFEPNPPFPDPNGSISLITGTADFKTHSWPFIILNNNQLQFLSYYYYLENPESEPNYHKADYQMCRISFNLNLPLVYEVPPVSPFYIYDAFNAKRIINSSKNQINIDKPAYKNSDSSSTDRYPIANFIYGFFEMNYRDVILERHNNLFGPINLKEIFEPNDFNNITNTTQWIAYKKNNLTYDSDDFILEKNIDNNHWRDVNVAYANNMRVVFDGLNNESPQLQTLLYVVSPINSNDSKFNSPEEFLSAYTHSNIYKVFQVEKSFFKNSHTKNTDINDGKGFDFWKIKIQIDNEEIDVLKLTGFGSAYQSLKQSLMIGITKANYDNLFAGTTAVYNPYFHLEDLEECRNNNVVDAFKARLGIRYENEFGEIITHINEGGNTIYVYSIDGKIFTTKEYAEKFEYHTEFAETYVEFLPKTSWDGEYGFDWMRKAQPAPDYDSFKNIVGSDPDQTDGNDPVNPNFQPDISMYVKLKNEHYDSIPIPWRINSGDTDEEYHTSWLRLEKEQEIEIKVRLKIKTKPERLKFMFDAREYQITSSFGNVISAKQKNEWFKFFVFNDNLLVNNSINEDITLTIKRKNDSKDDNNRFVIWATENGKDKPAGYLKIAQEKVLTSPKIIFVGCKTQLPPQIIASNFTIEELNTQRNNAQRYLKQAGYNPEITVIPEIDLTQDPHFSQVNGHYVSGETIRAGYQNQDGSPVLDSQLPAGYINIRKYLISKLPNTVSHDNKTLIVFFIKQNGAFQILPGNNLGFPLGGFSGGNNTDVVIFGSPQIQTVAHEIYHSLGIPHTFDNKGKFAYKGMETDNLMDYSHLMGRHRRSTYKWQWNIARKNAEEWNKRN